MPFCRELVEESLGAVAAAEVAHYTRIGTLNCLFPSYGNGWTSARSSPVQFLNDRMELELGLRVLLDASEKKPQSRYMVRNAIRGLLDLPGGLTTDAFQMSFSGSTDELGQWRGYAANGMGCSVVTDAMAVKQFSDVAGWVIYDPKKQTAFANKVLKKLRGQTQPGPVQQALVAAACFMKHPGFAPEKEFRLLRFPSPTQIEFRESADRLVPYFDFLRADGASLPVTKIIIGPGWQLQNLTPQEFGRNHVVEGVRRLLEARRMAVEVQPSSIPYDPR